MPLGLLCEITDGSCMTVAMLLSSKSACVGLLCQTLAHLEELLPLVGAVPPMADRQLGCDLC